MALSDNGAVRKNGASVDCENVTFTNNTADKGGAIGIPYDCVTSLSCSLNLTDCTFAGNQAAEGSDASDAEIAARIENATAEFLVSALR